MKIIKFWEFISTSNNDLTDSGLMLRSWHIIEHVSYIKKGFFFQPFVTRKKTPAPLFKMFCFARWEFGMSFKFWMKSIRISIILSKNLPQIGLGCAKSTYQMLELYLIGIDKKHVNL